MKQNVPFKMTVEVPVGIEILQTPKNIIHISILLSDKLSKQQQKQHQQQKLQQQQQQQDQV